MEFQAPLVEMANLNDRYTRITVIIIFKKIIKKIAETNFEN